MAVSKKEMLRIASIFSGSCSKTQVCPVKDIMATYSDKWSMYTILLLGQHQKLRFNELRSAVSGISQRMLAVTLRSLEEDGIISRTLYLEIPARVEYQLTNLGESLLKQILSFASWAEENFDEILQARKKYKKQKA
ncbi:MAG: transcriptional regulator [Flavisolibacter sp.]|jgi:DNA-binding HxlR family transcriptional regulator|nr:transcriptional regulator [Flavisolibacter sp.]